MPRQLMTSAAAFLVALSAVTLPIAAVAHPKPITPEAATSSDGSSNPTGYIINRQGFGNYVAGRNGSFGGYPAGSAGAHELQMNQEQKCRDVPETC